MTTVVCSGVADSIKWRVVNDPNWPPAQAAATAAAGLATKDCRWVPKGHPMVAAGSPQCAAYQKQLDAILWHSSPAATPAAPTGADAIIMIVGIVAAFVAVGAVTAALSRGFKRLVQSERDGVSWNKETVRADAATLRAVQAEAEVQRLAEHVKRLEVQLQAARAATGRAAAGRTASRAAAGARYATPPEPSGSFAKLKALVIRELHPDGNPQASPQERTMRAELFKALWPQIERLEKNG